MYRIKCVEEIFCPFSPDKSSLAVVQVQGEESKAGLPFVDQPAASDYCLGWLVRMEPVHDQQEYKSFISVICFQIVGDCQKDQHGNKLHGWIFLKVFDEAESKISQEQGEKYILFVGKQQGAVLCEVPRNLGNTGEDQKIPSIFKTVMGVEKSLYQKKTENGKSGSAHIPHDAIKGISGAPKLKQGAGCRRVVAEQKRCGVVDQHDHHGKYLQGAAA